MRALRLAFIVDRYGIDVAGGAELLCRELAKRLSVNNTVEVISTCAIDYMTWANEYPEGTQEVEGVKVHRFKVDSPRDVKDFNEFSLKILGTQHTIQEELEWMKKQGPYSSDLFKFLATNREGYDIFLFFSYLYCTTFFGMKEVSHKSVLIPLAHDEPPIYLAIFKEVFNSPKGIIYMTPEEKRLVNKIFHNDRIPSVIAGFGIEEPIDANEIRFRRKLNLWEPYILYLGRIDESKGCRELIENFLRYKRDSDSKIKLVLLGKKVMPIPPNPEVIWAGFLPEYEFDAIQGSSLVVMPSRFESLSIATLEAMIMAKPVLVNGSCDVLKAHCLRSNGGLYYSNYDEFSAALDLLLNDELLARRLGENGRKYVLENYSWEIVQKKYEDFLAKIFATTQGPLYL